MQQHNLNIEIERFIAEKDSRGELYYPDDVFYINRYEGAGGQGKHGASGEGILYEFYTPQDIVDLMWELAASYGYNGGTMLEPACGTGRFFKKSQDYSACTGFEINDTSARIAEITYPGVTVHRGYFQTAFMEAPRFYTRMKNPLTWLTGYPFSLVIGNPPYGMNRNLYSTYFPTPKIPQIEIFFMYYGLRLLKAGGLLIYLTSSNFLRNGITYKSSKDNIGKIADFIDAYRLPSVFKNSDVPTDIVIFRKK